MLIAGLTYFGRKQIEVMLRLTINQYKTKHNNSTLTMKSKFYYYLLLLGIISYLGTQDLAAQSITQRVSNFFTSLFDTTPRAERSLARQGNDAYAAGKYDEAESNYRKSFHKNPEGDINEAIYNMGNSLFQQERYGEAAEKFNNSVEQLTDKNQKAKAYHNMGNSLLRAAELSMEEPEKYQQALGASIESFKNALRNNPTDEDTRYNLAYAQTLLKQLQQQQEKQQNKECNNPKDSDGEQKEQKDQEKQNKNQQQQDKEQEQQQKNEEQKKQEEQQKQEQQQKEEERKKEEEQQGQQSEEEQKKEEEEQKQAQQGEEQDKKEEEQTQPQPQDQAQPKEGVPEQRTLSKEEARRLLEALKNEELRVQQKLQKMQSKGSPNRTDKDW